MTIDEKIVAVKKFIQSEAEDCYKLAINLRMTKRALLEAKENMQVQLGTEIKRMEIGLKMSAKYQGYLKEILEELEKGIDFELKDIPTA